MMGLKEEAAVERLRQAKRGELRVAERLVADLDEPGHPVPRNVFSQSHRGDMPPHEVMIAGEVLSWLYAGGGYLRIDIGACPGPDKDVAGNSEKLRGRGRLSSVLPDAPAVNFTGSFWGGNQDEDGSFCWDERVHLNVREKQDAFWLPAGSAPLEVGYVRAWQLSWHLRLCKRVARWPYGDTAITVLALREDFWAEHVAARLA